MLHEYKHAWNMSARACFFLFSQLEKCMVLYRYELATGLEVPYIRTKFGTSDPNRIIYERLLGNSIMLFHLDVFKNDSQKLRYLIDWCRMYDINLYLPMEDFDRNKVSYSMRDNTHIPILSSIIDEYEVKRYDLRNINYNNSSQIESAISEKMKPLLRDIKLKNLLD
jgi:hypothetical protein